MGVRVSRYSQNTRDANEDPLLRTARALGAGFWQAPPLDGWVIHRGVWQPAEIKMPHREGHKHEYTPSQLRFLRFAADAHAPVLIWRTDEDVIASLGGVIAAGGGRRP